MWILTKTIPLVNDIWYVPMYKRKEIILEFKNTAKLKVTKQEISKYRRATQNNQFPEGYRLMRYVNTLYSLQTTFAPLYHFIEFPFKSSKFPCYFPKA